MITIACHRDLNKDVLIVLKIPLFPAYCFTDVLELHTVNETIDKGEYTWIEKYVVKHDI